MKYVFSCLFQRNVTSERMSKYVERVKKYVSACTA